MQIRSLLAEGTRHPMWSGRRDLRTPCRLMTFQALYRATVIIDVDVVEPAPRNFPHKSTTTTP